MTVEQLIDVLKTISEDSPSMAQSEAVIIFDGSTWPIQSIHFKSTKEVRIVVSEFDPIMRTGKHLIEERMKNANSIKSHK